MLASRAPVVAELLIASVATALVAMTLPPEDGGSFAAARVVDASLDSPRTGSPPPSEMRVVHVELRSAPRTRDCSLSGNRGALYRARDFGAVALALGSCSGADLMRELDRTYMIATAVDADLRDRFDAVREAYRIDLAFGGAHSSELVDAEKMIAARYVNELTRTHDALRFVDVSHIALALRMSTCSPCTRGDVLAHLSGVLSPAAKNAAQ
jgi:hypothetical protein